MNSAKRIHKMAPPTIAAPSPRLVSDLSPDAPSFCMAQPSWEDYPAAIEDASPDSILHYIQTGQVWVVNHRRRNGLILYKKFHAEFAGPGAAIGGSYDQDCQQVIPVGNLSLVRPESHKEQQDAYLIRRQWIKLTQQFTDQSSPLKRAQMILNQFETYFDQQTIARIPDEAFAMLVGVLPYSIRIARRPPGKMQIKVKT
jgi:hypothetical protein